jgi:hypothetical protein
VRRCTRHLRRDRSARSGREICISESILDIDSDIQISAFILGRIHGGSGSGIKRSPFHRLQLLRLLGRDTGPLTDIDLSTADPFAQRLW